MDTDILVDSNIYIDLLRAGMDPPQVLGGWAGNAELVTCGMVRLEVLRGIKSRRLRTVLSDFLDILINVPSDHRLWNEAADLASSLDRRGAVIPAADAVIATCALRLGAAILTSDSHFHAVRQLQVITPPPDWHRPHRTR